LRKLQRGNLQLRASDFLTDAKLERRLGKMPLSVRPGGAMLDMRIESATSVPKKSGISDKSKLVAGNAPKITRPCPKSRRVQDDGDYSDDDGLGEPIALDEDQTKVNRMEKAAKRYNQRSNVARFGHQLQVHL
jgi:hypothetical protein